VELPVEGGAESERMQDVAADVELPVDDGAEAERMEGGGADVELPVEGGAEAERMEGRGADVELPHEEFEVLQIQAVVSRLEGCVNRDCGISPLKSLPLEKDLAR
jgi:hypothetical protein